MFLLIIKHLFVLLMSLMIFQNQTLVPEPKADPNEFSPFVSQNPSRLPAKMPDDFSFNIFWGHIGQHYYDSKTGKVYKQYFEEVRDELEADLVFSEKDMEEIWSYIYASELDRYPRNYQAGVGEITPPFIVGIEVEYGENNYQVTANEIVPYTSASKFVNPEVARLLINLAYIVEKIEGTEEWKNLPPPMLMIE